MATAPTSTEALSIPLDGLDEAQIQLGFGGGELTIHPAEPHMLIAGTFEGGVIQTSRDPGTIKLEPRDPARTFVARGPVHWDVGVTTEIPVDLRLDTGGNRSVIDLAALRIRRLELHTGASETNIRLPAAGQTVVRIDCGFAAVNIDVPPGVAARISGRISLGSTDVDETRFPRSGKGWASAEYETALNRVDITIAGGFGSARVT
jgi:hypothetical protein